MKTAVTLAFLMLALPAMLGEAAAQNHGRERVSLAVTTVAVRSGLESRSDTLLLWNRNVRARPVGHAIKSCIRAGVGGILGGGAMTCSLVISLPLGKVVATGIVHSLRRYTLVVTGGTGVYEGARGPLFVTAVSGNGVRRMTFYL